MKRIISLLLSAIIILSMTPAAFAATDEAVAAADALNAMGLFSGVGTDANGKPIYDLDRAPTRHEAIVLLVALLGKKEEAANGTWKTPFTDVADWAKSAVGYAYANKLTSGTSATTFGGNQTISASQYLTFVLTALGYRSGTDFAWDKAWELSDKLGITNGQYNAASVFNRGDVVQISYAALNVKMKGSEQLLKETIGLEESAKSSIIPEGAKVYISTFKGYCTQEEIDKTIWLDPWNKPNVGDKIRSSTREIEHGFNTQYDINEYVELMYFDPETKQMIDIPGVTWVSENENIIKLVDGKLVEQNTVGTTNLIATLSDGTTFTIKCTVPTLYSEFKALFTSFKSVNDSKMSVRATKSPAKVKAFWDEYGGCEIMDYYSKKLYEEKFADESHSHYAAINFSIRYNNKTTILGEYRVGEAEFYLGNPDWSIFGL